LAQGGFMNNVYKEGGSVNAKLYDFEARRKFRDKGREIIARHERKQIFWGKVQQWVEVALMIAMVAAALVLVLKTLYGFTK
jgi:hypothetical protein